MKLKSRNVLKLTGYEIFKTSEWFPIRIYLLIKTIVLDVK